MGLCEECSPQTSGAINPMFLVPVGVVFAYIAFRKLLHFRHELRQKKLGVARKMFEDMDTDGSGEVTRDEMRDNLALLGLEMDDDTAIILVESIDIDHSGDIDIHEFMAWMG